ncbi:sensor histidine kinase [Streptomyces purpurogeneiscleroticus]|uniref:sensor histidine kinase n=1 Tax=Streptomyces purpurogeneiscleroticus TaxID=68259 RepID=UPI001CBD9640|nr:sensor histidine kinase [Streptomyces purpurogeneiscleroticus]
MPQPQPQPQSRPQPRDGDPDARRLAAVIHVTFFVLLGSSMARFIQRHGGEAHAPWVIALAVVLAVLYVAGLYVTGPGRGAPAGPPLPPGTRVARPPARRLVWLGAVVLVWAVLVVLAPSFAWVAVPLFYAALRTLPPQAAYVLVAVLTVFVISAQLTLARRFDLDLVIGPAAVATFATAIFMYMQRQAARQRALIDDLVRTRRELAATERREGTLAERQRLSMEIHDSLAQGLSSQRMLLQAAERTWDADPAKARGHVRTAASIAEHNLTEARRFVHDLAPADLAEGGLPEALHALAAREGDDRLAVRVHIDDPTGAPLPDLVQSGLLRIAQGALANVREHAGATTAALTLTTLDDQVVLDVADNGRGFDPVTLPDAPTGVRGHGIPAIRARVRQLGGTLTIESAPGEGAVLTAAIPLERPSLPLEQPQ